MWKTPFSLTAATPFYPHKNVDKSYFLHRGCRKVSYKIVSTGYLLNFHRSCVKSSGGESNTDKPHSCPFVCLFPYIPRLAIGIFKGVSAYSRKAAHENLSGFGSPPFKDWS